MTYHVSDSAPDNWHRTHLSSDYLNLVDDYFTEHKDVVYKMSGAVSWNACLGASTTTLAFENADDMVEFDKWFNNLVDKKTLGEQGAGIYISFCSVRMP